MMSISNGVWVTFVAMALLCLTLTEAATGKSKGGAETKPFDWQALTLEDLKDIAVLKLLLSKVLSFGIIAGAFFLKVPQIVKLMASKSAVGLSLVSWYLETLGYTMSAAFNFLQGTPVTAYAENLVIVVQNLVVIALMWKFNGTGSTTCLVMIALFTGACYGLLSCPAEFQETMFLVTLPIGAAARIPQIWVNFKNGHTGQMAFMSLFMSWAGCSARIFTSLAEVGVPKLVLYSFLLAFVWNTILFLQMVWYWK